jgi:NADH-quinone oxidoreductase subunit J
MFFYLFSFLTILSALGVVLCKNPIHSVLSLIFSFINCAGLFILIGAEFLAMMLVIVYVGAVAVLFLFVIMMLDIDYESLRTKTPVSATVLGITTCTGLLFAVAQFMQKSFTSIKQLSPVTSTNALTNTEMIGDVLYSDFLVPFQIGGIVLLVAIVGAITLTERKRNTIKKQDPAKQLQRNRASSITIVNIENNSQVKGINYDL